MKSEKYSCFTDKFYQNQKSDFNKIIKTNSYFLLRDLPVEVACRILLPEIPQILSKQKNDGLWQNSTKVTYDILSTLKFANVLEDLIANKKMKNVLGQITDKYDYHSLLMKLLIFHQTNEKAVVEIKKIVQDIKNAQNDDGSWENTVVATVYHIEKLLSLGIMGDDSSIEKGIAFLFKHLNLKWSGLQSSGKAYGLQTSCFFSTENRDLEFEAAKKYYAEFDPKLVCFRHLGVIQNSLCLKLFLKLGFESDERITTALDCLFEIFKKYDSLCYFRVQKKFMLKNPVRG
jgi:hypothetical protein